MLHKGIEIRSAHSRISLAEILSRPVALQAFLGELVGREEIRASLKMPAWEATRWPIPSYYEEWLRAWFLNF